MKRIGLTQRAHTISGISERRDMLDQRWAQLIERLGACPVPLANAVHDPRRYLDALGLDALVMTGGNDLTALPDASDPAPERDLFEAEAFRYFREKGLPVLGVCRGAQMINVLAGGRLERIDKHIALRHALTWRDGLPHGWDRPGDVNSYHGWAIPQDGLAAGLEAAARADDGSIEAFYTTDSAVTGIVWHPERELDLPDTAMAFLARARRLPPASNNTERPE